MSILGIVSNYLHEISLSREPYLCGQLFTLLRASLDNIWIQRAMDTIRIEGNKFWVNSQLKTDNYYAHIPIFAADVR